MQNLTTELTNFLSKTVEPKHSIFNEIIEFWINPDKTALKKLTLSSADLEINRTFLAIMLTPRACILSFAEAFLPKTEQIPFVNRLCNHQKQFIMAYQLSNATKQSNKQRDKLILVTFKLTGFQQYMRSYDMTLIREKHLDTIKSTILFDQKELMGRFAMDVIDQLYQQQWFEIAVINKEEFEETPVQVLRKRQPIIYPADEADEFGELETIALKSQPYTAISSCTTTVASTPVFPMDRSGSSGINTPVDIEPNSPATPVVTQTRCLPFITSISGFFNTTRVKVIPVSDELAGTNTNEGKYILR